MEEITKMHVDWKKITVVGALVLLTALTVGGLTWYVADNGFQNELEAYKNEIATLQTEVAQLKAEEAPAEAAPTADAKVYSNTDYDYQLTFGEKWKTYQAKVNTDLVVGEFSSVAIQVPVKDYPTGYNTLLTVTVMSKTRYDELKALGGSVPTLVKNTDTYYYTYTPNGADIKNDYGITAADIKTVGDSLTLTSN